MNELRIKNHFVSESYLKRWQDSDNKICVYKTLVSHPNSQIWRKHSAAAIAYQKHLYTQIISGSESDELERWLDKNYESPANEVIEKAICEKRLSIDDWSVLIRFLAAQDVRTPARLIEHIKRNESIFQEILQNSLNDLKQKLETKDVSNLKEKEISEEYTNILPLKITAEIEPGKEEGILKAESYVGRSSWINSIKYLLENTAKILHTHKWTIIKPANGYSWFTSDNPVIKLNYKSQNNYDLKGGWGRNKGNIFFPIGSQHAMFVQIGDKPMPKGSRLTVEQTMQFRKFTAENSHRKIFSNHFDDEIPIMKPRIVNKERVLSEKNELDTWHERNSKLEQEFLKSNN